MASDIKFSDEAKLELAKIFSTHLYRRAKEHVLESVEVQVLGSTRAVNQTALDLAMKEGMRKAFHDLEKIALPQAPGRVPVLPRPVSKRTPTEEQS